MKIKDDRDAGRGRDRQNCPSAVASAGQKSPLQRRGVSRRRISPDDGQIQHLRTWFVSRRPGEQAPVVPPSAVAEEN